MKVIPERSNNMPIWPTHATKRRRRTQPRPEPDPGPPARNWWEKDDYATSPAEAERRRKEWISPMTDQPKVTNDDCRIAALGVIHWAVGDIAALNHVLDPVEDDHKRAIAVLLGTLQTVFGIAPELREPARIQRLREVVAKLSGDDDDPQRPPKRIY